MTSQNTIDAVLLACFLFAVVIAATIGVHF